ncbi:MAG: SMP-30/gluconolactonase/LRE family protein [Deltaproteobacteria bacterium]|nr:SMP-30/gluconolactonase/LRE family protein [Deltaproteobacteria bacterium]MBW2497285.1 SMP-30/gluconolactonase/LRE family protein [Deltaproteobacteria bacterium]
MNRFQLGIAFLIASGALGPIGCSAPLEPLPRCDAEAERAGRSICGVRNPEDLALLPGRRWLLVSEMAPMEATAEEGSAPPQAGSLLAIRLSDGKRRRLYPTDLDAHRDAGSGAAVRASLGDPGCSGPPDPAVFLPHGVDVGGGPGGEARVAVVNHGGREAIEIFEIRFQRGPVLEWRGCVPMPEGLMANDVAWLPDGGFVVTNFAPVLEGSGLAALWTGFEILTGRETGAVYRWTPGAGLALIEGSEGSAPNGIAVAPDGRTILVAEWGADSVYRLRIDGEGGGRRRSVDLEHSPDNLSWMRDGRLLVAAQAGGLTAALACNEIEEVGCDIEHAVYAIDPVSLEATRLFVGRGAASVALEAGDEILVGFFKGDQIERVARAD